MVISSSMQSFGPGMAPAALNCCLIFKRYARREATSVLRFAMPGMGVFSRIWGDSKNVAREPRERLIVYLGEFSITFS
jgi:hypothetical protein